MDHENGRIRMVTPMSLAMRRPSPHAGDQSPSNGFQPLILKHEHRKSNDEDSKNVSESSDVGVKTECQRNDGANSGDEDDEYIEVENVENAAADGRNSDKKVEHSPARNDDDIQNDNDDDENSNDNN